MENQNEITERLSALLSDPEGLERIKSMAAGLLGINPPPPQKEEESSPFGDIDIGSITKIAGLLKSRPAENEKTRLLMALKPHLSVQRQKRVDMAVKILKLLELMPMLSELGIFNL